MEKLKETLFEACEKEYEDYNKTITKLAKASNVSEMADFSDDAQNHWNLYKKLGKIIENSGYGFEFYEYVKQNKTIEKEREIA